jgi:RNAse (barnase) inhibitor barstar
MNDGFDIDLGDTGQNGVYFVGSGDLATLAEAATTEGLLATRIDLGGCKGKDDLLARLATALSFPADFGGNWDALADSLRDLSWLHARGHVLLFDRIEELRAAAEDDLDTLLDILDETAEDDGTHAVPFYAFLALPESDFDAADEN